MLLSCSRKPSSRLLLDFGTDYAAAKKLLACCYFKHLLARSECFTSDRAQHAAVHFERGGGILRRLLFVPEHALHHMLLYNCLLGAAVGSVQTASWLLPDCCYRLRRECCQGASKLMQLLHKGLADCCQTAASRLDCYKTATKPPLDCC